ncbi:hypothetical protein F4802DRAFT_585254 [Xylaria palmicola]|nr:hypothetical protein F4802DRAFT_585254 [Xylaria palmicola]
MAPGKPTPTIPRAITTGSDGGAETPASQRLPSSRSWKNVFQQQVNPWRRQNSADFLAENESITPGSNHNSTVRSSPILPGFTNRQNNTASSPGQAPSLQSESVDSLTSASLFSRNSHRSLGSSYTDTTSISSLSAGGVVCSVDDKRIKPYKRMKNNSVVYLAHDDIELPADVVKRWDTTDFHRLQTDLKDVIEKIYCKGVKRESRRRRSMLYTAAGPPEYDVLFELRMSGRAAHDAQYLQIGPSIWIICGSTWACKDIRTAINEITWPILPVEIHEGRPPVPAADEGNIDIDLLDLTNGYHLGNSVMLYIHVEDAHTELAWTYTETSCGLICCATIKDGDTYSHRFSRIGGLVMATNTLKSSQFGVSTAHGMLDYPWWHNQLYNTNLEATWDCQSGTSDDDDEDDFDSGSLFGDQERLYTEPHTSRDPCSRTGFFSLEDSESGEGYRDPQLVSRWRNVSHHGVLSFLGASITTKNNTQHPIQLQAYQTDHAMIRLDRPQGIRSQPWNNTYRPRKSPQAYPIDITRHANNDELTEGSVNIICQANSSLDARLLPGSVSLAMGGKMFTLRKLKATAPLARGVSGSWVARGPELCGMVIAVSNPEPYVYMMRAEDLMSNIEASSPSIESIEVFSSHIRRVGHKEDGIHPQNQPSKKPQRRLVTAFTSPKAPGHDRRPMTSIKRGLSTRIRSLSGPLRSPEATGSFLIGEKNIKLQRSRSVRGLLSDMFRTKVEEIIQPVEREGKATEPLLEMQKLTAAGNPVHAHGVAQPMRPPFPRRKRRLAMPLEPISEVSSVVTFGAEDIQETEYVFLTSTAYDPTTTFKHGLIRLRKLDLLPRREPNEKVDRECPEYKIALGRTAHHWLFDNYQSQHEDDVDEVGDLIEWWDSWGIEDPGGLITDRPFSPTNSGSDNPPDVSYSDTTSENSVNSCRTWISHADSAAHGYFAKSSYEFDRPGVKKGSVDELPDNCVGIPSLDVVKAGSPEITRPSIDEEDLPSGQCRYILLNPEVKGQRCGCANFTLNHSLSGRICLCGHLTCYHIKSSERPPDENEIADLRQRIQMLEDQLDRKTQISDSQDIEDCYRSVNRRWLSFDELNNKYTAYKNRSVSYDERPDSQDDALQRLSDQVVQIDKHAMALEERDTVYRNRSVSYEERPDSQDDALQRLNDRVVQIDTDDMALEERVPLPFPPLLHAATYI